jgi:flagellar hook protein FlgE
LTTNRDNSFRLANSQETVNDNGLYLTGSDLSYATISAANLAPNTITFNTHNEPILELRPNGDIYVQGRLAANDMEVVSAMRRFLGTQGLL